MSCSLEMHLKISKHTKQQVKYDCTERQQNWLADMIRSIINDLLSVLDLKLISQTVPQQMKEKVKRLEMSSKE